MSITDRIRQKLRSWLLTEQEREIVGRVSELESDWSAISSALKDAGYYGEDIEVDEHDILVIMGDQNLIQAYDRPDRAYLGGQDNSIETNRQL